MDWNLQIGDIGNDEQQCVHLNDDDDLGNDKQCVQLELAFNGFLPKVICKGKEGQRI